MSGEQKPLVWMLVNDLDPGHWDWPDVDAVKKDHILSGGAAVLGGFLLDRLVMAAIRPKMAYSIIHDHDVYDPEGDDEERVWDQATHAWRIGPKPDHLHMLVVIDTREDAATVRRLGEILGVDERQIEKNKTKGGKVRGCDWSLGFDNWLAYVRHAKDLWKHQYDPEEVATLSGPDYLAVEALRRRDWRKGAAVKRAQRDLTADDLELVLQMIGDDELDLAGVLRDPVAKRLYARHRSSIDDALRVAEAARGVKAVDALMQHLFRTLGLVFYGDSNAGKSYFLRELMGPIFQSLGWRVGRAAKGRNSVDHLRDEQVYLIQDVAPKALGAERWTGFDPEEASPSGNRYLNNLFAAPRVVALTRAVEDPFDYFIAMADDAGGAFKLNELLRRVAWAIKVLWPDESSSERLYWFRQMERVETYRLHDEDVNYRLSDGVVFTEVGAVAAMTMLVNQFSPDMGLDSSPEWPAITAKVKAEVEAHRVRMIESAEAVDMERRRDDWVAGIKSTYGAGLAAHVRAAHTGPGVAEWHGVDVNHCETCKSMAVETRARQIVDEEARCQRDAAEAAARAARSAADFDDRLKEWKNGNPRVTTAAR